MSIFTVMTRVTPKWLMRKSKSELASIIMNNLDRIDLFAADPIRSTSDSSVPNGGFPLRAEVRGDILQFAIGVDTLAFAFEHGERNNPFDESANDFRQELHVVDHVEFANDVCHEMNREGEDGSTPLTRFLDSMMDEAVDQGSLGISDPDETSDSTVPEHTEIRSENN